MIVARTLTKRFGRITAVDAINFEVPKGQVVGFLGPNGAGKSTTIRMITGYLPPTEGSIEVGGMNVATHGRRVRGMIGYLAESSPLYAEMRVSEYLDFRGRLFGLARVARRTSAAGVIDRCGLDNVQRRPIGQLSKGYRQRVGLAAALLHDPPVVILDEPTSGLDPTQIREVRALIRSLAETHTILLSTHILPEVELTCDRVILIAGGKIRGQGSIRELRSGVSGTSRYIVETDAAQAQQALSRLPAVADVEARQLDGTWYRLTVTAKDEVDDLREPISKALAEVKSITRELHRQQPTLEHMFMQMVADGEQADAVTRRPAGEASS